MKAIVEGLAKRRSHWLVIIIFALLYILLRSDGFVTLLPNAMHDDALQFRLAQNISSGQWLGAYNSLTLAKGVVYPVWLAGMNAIDIPLWLAQTLLYVAASMLIVFAIRGLFSNRWVLVVIFLILISNPMLPDRVYRDAIASQILLLVLVWSLGLFLTTINKKHPVTIKRRDFVIYTVIGSIALPAWWFLREDYFWIVPYLLIVLLITLILTWFGARTKLKTPPIFKTRIAQTLLLLAPFMAVFLTGLSIAGANYLSYGRFVVNDYVSSEFESAYGAMTRVHDDAWKPTVPVSESMRRRLYKASPLFAKLESCLDGPGVCKGFKNVHYQIKYNDYEGGWFFWALRMAVEDAGYYKTPSMASQYYEELASQINNDCESGKLRCDYGKRSSLASPFRPEILPSVESNLLQSSAYFFSFKEASVFYEVGHDTYVPAKQVMADYYDVRYKTDELNFTAKLKLKLQRLVAKLYEKMGIVLSALTMLALGVLTILLFVPKTRLRISRPEMLTIGLSWTLLLTLIMARLVMFAYVTTTSFNAIDKQYFSSLYPILLIIEGLILGSFMNRFMCRTKTGERNGSSKSKVRAKGQS